MQSKDGGWGAFDADNTREIVNKLPFCDFGAVIDPPSADVTAHIVEALAAGGPRREHAVRRGVVWLLPRKPTAPGSGAGARTTSTARARPSRRSSPPGCCPPSRPSAARSRGSKPTRTPTADGARTCGPTTTRRWPGAAPPPPPRRPGRCWRCWRPAAPDRGGTRGPLAGRDPARRWFLGRAAVHRHRLPGDFYINYHLYRLAFPVSALGRYVRGGVRAGPTLGTYGRHEMTKPIRQTGGAHADAPGSETEGARRWCARRCCSRRAPFAAACATARGAPGGGASRADAYPPTVMRTARPRAGRPPRGKGPPRSVRHLITLHGGRLGADLTPGDLVVATEVNSVGPPLRVRAAAGRRAAPGRPAGPRGPCRHR